ncbi:probable E3 ubiquitin-protein ligase makorin-1 [Xenia sp. Carnegie-2017]|uniref:probable E3 ubiquitin-protein ligase makorin-1 n=1 Tax=Xenia sp. Carnegie-2017 TaxID=2897299 RepID=UPI001F0346AB|nr:probable E3 ubiquitin-protein ligase makorin-1 [Xenia sp. Carnegie-2017]
MATGISKTDVLCKYFQNGVCQRGENCSFSHDRSTRPDMTCRFYLQGTCSYGANCRFDHIKADRKTRQNFEKPKTLVSNEKLFQHLVSERPSKLVSLSKGSTKQCENEKIFNWAEAPTFVPGTKYQSRNNSSELKNSAIKEDFSYSDVARTGIELTCVDEMTDEEAGTILCPFAAVGTCSDGDSCPFLHGLRCEVCDCYCLDPNDPEQQKEHRSECMKWLEDDMNYSFAVQKSDEVCCGICLDKIRLNPDSKDKRFGILPECNHPFCLTCIRKWRSSSKTKDKFVRACPICRISSGFVIPSEVWIDDPLEKAKLIKMYKDALSKKPCKYFDTGKGSCPFGSSCFYKHANPDGSIAKVNIRRYSNSKGESLIVNSSSLWEFIEARDGVSLEELLESLFE